MEMEGLSDAFPVYPVLWARERAGYVRRPEEGTMTRITKGGRFGAAALAILVGALALKIAPAGGAEKNPAGAAGAGPPSAELPKPLVIPESEKQKKNPVPKVPEALASGKSLFESQCGMCHGVKGDGKGDLALQKKWPMPDFTDPAWQTKRSDGELFYIMSTGHGEMPAEKRLPEQNKWEIILHIRSLSRAAVPPTAH
jgi:mono/diheme cytochrome c family protein